MHIEAVERQQTTEDRVVERIVRIIKEQSLSPGERLPGEHDLVEQFKVSRPVLRETLARVRAIRNRAPNAAAEAMQEHLQAVLDHLVREAP
jgi:DNA-binding FadR family transcriptional regulator